MARAWRRAASELGIRFVSPYALADGDDTYWCAGWLPDFGGRKGAVIIGRQSADGACDAAEKHGYYVSGLNPRYYEKYNRECFIETLSDWGWKGDKNELPSWYCWR